jgi:riboflavin synthase
MFTGIIGEVGKVISLQSGKLAIAASQVVKGLELGGSVGVNGACLTATVFDNTSFAVDLSPETLQRTSLGRLRTGDPLNLERPMCLGGELGGHLVQGHVDGVGTITEITPQNGATLFGIKAPHEIMRYLVEKAYIAVEGISLTITDLGSDFFRVSVVEFTRTHTNLQYHKSGDSVNLEVDIMAKYAERFIQKQKSDISVEFLKEHGFQ